MSRLALLLGLSFAVLALLPSAAAAQGPLPPVRIGDQFPLTFEVPLPPDATVEVDTASPSWGALVVVEIGDIAIEGAGVDRVASISVTLAAFTTGDMSFQPAVLVITGAEVRPLQLEPVTLSVVPTLPVDAPLELSPLAEPRAIGGAQPIWAIPAAVLGVILVAAIGTLAATRAARWFRDRPRKTPAPVAEPLPAPDLSLAVAQLDSDPVAAYRQLASTVRAALAVRYSFPARSLTTAELEGRMEAAGVDRWQARLVGGLLEECDAVVYAGYRPATERRHADLNMAREILEAG